MKIPKHEKYIMFFVNNKAYYVEFKLSLCTEVYEISIFSQIKNQDFPVMYAFTFRHSHIVIQFWKVISRSQDPHLPQPENRDSRSLFLLTQKLIDQTYSLAIIISPRYSILQKWTYSRTLVSSYEHICIVYRGPRDEVIQDGESDIILCRYSRYVETHSLPDV